MIHKLVKNILVPPNLETDQYIDVWGATSHLIPVKKVKLLSKPITFGLSQMYDHLVSSISSELEIQMGILLTADNINSICTIQNTNTVY